MWNLIIFIPKNFFRLQHFVRVTRYIAIVWNCKLISSYANEWIMLGRFLRQTMRRLFIEEKKKAKRKLAGPHAMRYLTHCTAVLVKRISTPLPHSVVSLTRCHMCTDQQHRKKKLVTHFMDAHLRRTKCERFWRFIYLSSSSFCSSCNGCRYLECIVNVSSRKCLFFFMLAQNCARRFRSTNVSMCVAQCRK